MGFITEIFSGGGSDAATDAANIQSASADRAIDLQRETLGQVRSDLTPFRQAGINALANQPGGLGTVSRITRDQRDLITDPNQQRDFVQSNPFFQSLADDAQRRIFNNQAARGKLGSGETAAGLQNELLKVGTGLVNQNIAQRGQNIQLTGQNVQRQQNLATLGANAAAGQATATQNANTAISDLLTGQGNALAAGQVGAANARSSGLSNLVGTALGIGKLLKI